MDSLKFQNGGNFYEGDYKEYITGEKTPKSYRNPALVKAMVNIRMIDTQGYGIHKMYQSQKDRYLPMPDYDLQQRMKSFSICLAPSSMRTTA